MKYSIESLRPRLEQFLTPVLRQADLDLSYEQIGEAFGISVGTATATVSQALARLRKTERGTATWTNAKN